MKVKKKQIRAFRFVSTLTLPYTQEMEKYEGRIGQVRKSTPSKVLVQFADGKEFYYPKKEVIEKIKSF